MSEGWFHPGEFVGEPDGPIAPFREPTGRRGGLITRAQRRCGGRVRAPFGAAILGSLAHPLGPRSLLVGARASIVDEQIALRPAEVGVAIEPALGCIAAAIPPDNERRRTSLEDSRGQSLAIAFHGDVPAALGHRRLVGEFQYQGAPQHERARPNRCAPDMREFGDRE